jgi:hypothetical protein
VVGGVGVVGVVPGVPGAGAPPVWAIAALLAISIPAMATAGTTPRRNLSCVRNPSSFVGLRG